MARPAALLKRVVKLLVSLAVRGWDVVSDGVRRLVGRAPRRRGVVLYYHAVQPDQRERFARQLDEVLRLTKPLRADCLCVPAGASHCSAVTFDDGFVSVLENALPELEARRIPWTLFVPSGNLGSCPAWVRNPDSPARRQTVLSAQQLVALKSRPLVTIGSHSVSHPNFLALDPSRASQELARSKADLEQILGTPVGLFSFPHGACDARSAKMAQDAGYQRVFTIDPSCADGVADGFVVGRVAADPDDWRLEFKLKLLGAYRWLSKPQVFENV